MLAAGEGSRCVLRIGKIGMLTLKSGQSCSSSRAGGELGNRKSERDVEERGRRASPPHHGRKRHRRPALEAPNRCVSRAGRRPLTGSTRHMAIARVFLPLTWARLGVR
jgi:hypothetical protein